MSTVAVEGAESINLRLDEYKDNGYSTHDLHPYPAKFIPQIPRELILKLTRPGDWVLDPFCGSGTTLVECGLIGRSAVGTDINPLSCKISRAKSTALSHAQLDSLTRFVAATASLEMKAPLRLPSFFAIDKWFTAQSQLELAQLLELIRRERDDAVRNFLEVTFSAIVIRASNQESDTRYKAIEKNLRPGDVFRMFNSRLSANLKKIREFSAEAKRVSLEVAELDSTMEATDHRKTFALAVTSPPYMNIYDYYLYHKHRMNWLGLDVASTQEKEFGSRNKHNDKGLDVGHYNDAVKRSIVLTRAQLRDDGKYCVIVGDSIWRGQLIKMNSNYDRIFSECGFKKDHEFAFPQRKYTRSFTSNMRTQHKDSYVLIYSK